MSYLTLSLVAAIAALEGCGGRKAAVGSPPPNTTPSSSVSPAAGFTTATFERTPCFGTCPVYRVSVSGSGSVRFEGIRNVDSVGTFTGSISATAVSSLRRAFDDAQYFTRQSLYGQSNCSPYGADAPRILTSITTSDKTKSIDHDLGCGNAAPAALSDLYRKFDEIVGTTRWIGRR
jgi:hypothetical protein